MNPSQSSRTRNRCRDLSLEVLEDRLRLECGRGQHVCDHARNGCTPAKQVSTVPS